MRKTLSFVEIIGSIGLIHKTTQLVLLEHWVLVGIHAAIFVFIVMAIHKIKEL